MEKEIKIDNETTLSLNEKESDITKITLTLADGTTRELDKGMVVTTKGEGENLVLSTEMCNITGSEMIEMLYGMSLIIAKLGLNDNVLCEEYTDEESEEEFED